MTKRRSAPRVRFSKLSLLSCAAAFTAIAGLALAPAPVLAQKAAKSAAKKQVTKQDKKAETAKAEPAAQKPLNIQLNKLETVDKNCRAYFVVNNTGEVAYKVLKLDLVLFQPNGVIGGRFAVDLGPLRAKKKSVRLFDLEDVTCDKTGSLLLNDVMECAADGDGKSAACLDEISLSSKAEAMLTQ